MAQQNGQPRLTISEPCETVPFEYADVSELPADKQVAAIAEKAQALQASLNLQDGPIVRTAYFKRDQAHADRLLIIIHHLAVDTVSWRILSEDIQLLYNQISEGKTPQLPPKTTSFKYWAEQLSAYSGRRIDEKETAFWLALAEKEKPRLPVDFNKGPNSEASLLFVEERLDADLTRQLIKEIPTRVNAQFLDILLTAMARAFGRWNGQHKVWLELEGHGRENLFDHVDLSRTVGWFTTLYPLHLDISGIADPLETLQKIKGQLRAVPNNGIGFGLLKYFTEDRDVKEKLAGIPDADIVFNYLGQFETNHSTSGAFRPIRDIIMNERSPRALRPNLWDISASVVDGVLNLRIAFSGNFFKEESVRAFLEFYSDELKRFVQYGGALQETVYSAADFDEAGLEDAELDNLLSELDDD